MRDYLTFIDREATGRFDAGMDAWDAARDIARELAQAASPAWVSGVGSASTSRPSTERSIPRTESPDVVELFRRMALLERGG